MVSRAARLAEVEERLALLEKAKIDLQAALATTQAETKKTAEELENARKETRAAEEAKARAEEAQKFAEDRRARGKDTIQQWCDAISFGSDAVQADLHGLLGKFGITPPDLSQGDNVEVAELFHWIHACVAMADSGADFKCELSAIVAARTLSAAVCKLLPVGASPSGGVTKAQLRCLCEPSFEWPSLDSLQPDALPPLPKNIAKNFAAYFHEKGRGLVNMEMLRMKDHLQAKAEAYARDALGEDDIGNLGGGVDRHEGQGGAGGGGGGDTVPDPGGV